MAIGPHTMTFGGETWHGVLIDAGTYDDESGALALTTLNDDGPICDVTVNPASLGLALPAGCILVKDRSENAGLLAELERLGLAARTGRVFASGLVQIPEARLTGRLAASA